MELQLNEHLSRVFDGTAIAKLRAQFAAEHVAPLRGFCPPLLLAAIKREASGLVEQFGITRDMKLAITDHTERHMRTVGQPVIREHGPLIHTTYFLPSIKTLLSRIVGEDLFTCPYPGEHYVISSMARTGDTHGWHWDDYSYGFVLVLEAPPYREGGFVQAVAGTAWDKADPDVHGALLKGQVRSYALAAGDAYVIKTNTTMHRVHPVRSSSRRLIVNTTWANQADLTRNMTHETNDILFGAA